MKPSSNQIDLCLVTNVTSVHCMFNFSFRVLPNLRPLLSEVLHHYSEMMMTTRTGYNLGTRSLKYSKLRGELISYFSLGS